MHFERVLSCRSFFLGAGILVRSGTLRLFVDEENRINYVGLDCLSVEEESDMNSI